MWLVLLGIVFTLPWPPIMRNPRRVVWQGATPGWSPKADVAAVEQRAAWDVQGWVDDGQAEIHAVLDEIERSLWLGLVDVREDVYLWRDEDCLLLAR